MKCRQCSAGFARQLEKDIFALNVSNFHFDTSVVDLKDYDQDNMEQETTVVFLLSTWTDGVPPKSAETFFFWLKDLVLDFRSVIVHCLSLAIPTSPVLCLFLCIA